MDWFPNSYDKEAIYLLDLGTSYILEMRGIRMAQQEAMGGGFPVVWVHKIYHHSFRVKLIGDDLDITQVFTWDAGGGE